MSLPSFEFDFPDCFRSPEKLDVLYKKPVKYIYMKTTFARGVKYIFLFCIYIKLERN